MIEFSSLAPPNPPMRLCRDCQHCDPECNYWCGRKVAVTHKVSLVHGESVAVVDGNWKRCNIERYGLLSNILPWRCGKSGKYFEEKE